MGPIPCLGHGAVQAIMCTVATVAEWCLENPLAPADETDESSAPAPAVPGQACALWPQPIDDPC